MDRKTGNGEQRKWRKDRRNLCKELNELAWISREYWEGFRIDRQYETRVYIDKDGIRLFQSSTIEADSPAASGSPPVHPLTRINGHGPPKQMQKRFILGWRRSTP